MDDLKEPLNTNVAEMDIGEEGDDVGEVSKDCDMADEDNGAENDDDEQSYSDDEDSYDDDDDDKIKANNLEFLKRILKNKTMRFDQLFASLINNDLFKESAEGRNGKKCFIYQRNENKSDEQNKRQALVQALDEFKEFQHPVIYGMYNYTDPDEY